MWREGALALQACEQFGERVVPPPDDERPHEKERNLAGVNLLRPLGIRLRRARLPLRIGAFVGVKAERLPAPAHVACG